MIFIIKLRWYVRNGCMYITAWAAGLRDEPGEPAGAPLRAALLRRLDDVRGSRLHRQVSTVRVQDLCGMRVHLNSGLLPIPEFFQAFFCANLGGFVVSMFAFFDLY